MKRCLLAWLAAVSLVANGQVPALVGEIPTKEDCLVFIAILPTFYSKKMSDFYQVNPKASPKELVEKIQWLAERGDKDLQFTYSQLLINGYCVPKDVCAAKHYMEKSRGGQTNWEKVYPFPPWPKDADAVCN